MNILLGLFTILIVNAEIPAKISYMIGTTTIQRGEKTYSAVLKAALYVNDVVTTGDESECEIQFSNYSLVHLEPNSSVKIERKEETKKGIFHRIFAKIGEVVSKVTKMNKGDEYEVRTEAAQAFIRGTTFKTNVEEDGSSSFSVFDGKVGVKSVVEGAEEMVLDKHFKSKIKKGELEPLVDKLSELEINAFVTKFKDFIDRGKILDELRGKIEEEKKKKEEELKKKEEEGKKKLKGLFK
jgi:hypothetical protein